ncbi:hypothetical protein SCLCIDRAFT_100323, partial [Scleroderma citrinum Foug A]
RSAPTSFKWVKGHNADRGNKCADALAAEGAAKPTLDDIDLSVPLLSKPAGMKLHTLTQASVYKLLRNGCLTSSRHPSPENKPRSRRNEGEMEEKSPDYVPSTQCFWKALGIVSHQLLPLLDIRTLHASLKIGEFWENIPLYEHRAQCSVCNEATESLEHILLDCHRGQANNIWTLAKAAWLTAFGDWPMVHLGTILGCGSVSPPTPQNHNHPNPRKSCLLRILLSESAHLIWVLRCEQVIQGTLHTSNVVRMQWHNKINHQLSLDQYIVLKWNRKPVTQEVVKRMWYPSLLQISPDLTEDWIMNPEVLVGIKPLQPPAHQGPRAVHGAPHY